MRESLEAQGNTLVKVHVAEDHFEAEILMGALQVEGITCVCTSHEEIAYDGLFVLQRGWGSILVSAEQAPRARQIIEEALRVYGKKSASAEAKLRETETEPESGTGGEP